MPLDIEVRVEGAAEISAKLTRFQAESRRLPRAFSNIKNRMVRTADGLAPKYGGKTRRSIRGRSSNMLAKVSAGGAPRRSHGGGVYVKMNHFGTRWRGQKPNPFLFRTLDATKDYARAQVQNAINDKLKETGLT